ncbi:ABATE domain-containing protein [Nocardiopsis flavescens]|uniref:Putative stress-induced transcription regulator n=1 Tax=Nocardiopsis flavescens TaxID=758803 RepID=A0A1M6WHU7_9ACTN|nr:ABATE domain-containing protein [Nocardiopsis flavescens]SHK93353.1 Putative stress-induced transcription regulator [Nocardiopsis flavescens]
MKTQTPVRLSPAAELIAAFVATGSTLGDRADLAHFLRAHHLAAEGAIPITLADLDEAIALREGIRAVLDPSAEPDQEALARGQKVLDGLRVTVRLQPSREQLAPAVVDEVRRGLARLAGAWAAVLATGEWRHLRL